MRINHYSMDGSYLGSSNRSPLMMKNVFIQPISHDRFLASYGEGRESERRLVYGFLNGDLEWIEDFMTVEALPVFQTSPSGFSPVPFTAGDECIATPDGRIMVIRPNEGRIEIYSGQGEILQYIERDWEFVPVTHEDREAVRQRYRDSSREESRELAEKVPFPDQYPAFRMATMDDSGRIWVEHLPKGSFMRYEGPTTYDVFDSDGIWLGTQQFDFRFTVSGEYAFRQYYAESGSPRLERFRLTSLVTETDPR